MWLLEHPPLYTAGTSAREADLVAPDRFPVFRTGRGGEFTYHGPGQRVGYVMLDLNRRGPDLRRYVATLEAWIIATLARFNVTGERREDRVGVWVRAPRQAAPPDGRPAEDKIAAIGIRVRRWVSFHGISLNVDPELEHYSGIVPCGISDYGVTSLVDLGIPVSMAEVDTALKVEFERLFGATAASPPGACEASRPSVGVLAATVLASAMAFIDGTVVTIALPIIQSGFHATFPQMQWVVNAYTLMLGALILVAGALGDRVGRRLIFVIGIGVFAVASLVCALAPERRRPDRRPRRAGDRRRASRAAEPCHHRRHLSARGARQRDRLLGGRLGDHHLARTADRRLPDRHDKLARRLPDQPAAVGRGALADLRACARRAAIHPRPARSTGGLGARRRLARRAHLRSDATLEPAPDTRPMIPLLGRRGRRSRLFLAVERRAANPILPGFSSARAPSLSPTS